MPRAGWLFLVALAPVLAFAQGTPPIEDQQPRVIVVPVPSDAPPDAGIAQPPPPPAPPPEPAYVPPSPPTPPPPGDRPVNTQPGPPLPVENPGDANPDAVQPPPSAMLDGHPREGSFLSGPGSMFFIVHHTLMGGLGVLATQMVPRIIRAVRPVSADFPAFDAFDGDARIAYLVGALIGAGVGFASSATWQFFNWVNYTTATFGLVNAVIGAMFGIGVTNLVTTDATPISWMGLIGALSGAWLTAFIGGGDMAFSKGILITSGAGWAAIYTALILGIVASTSCHEDAVTKAYTCGGADLRAGIDALLFMPAVGAAALAIATLKFNPSTEQVLRADIFGGGVGLAVFLLSALLVPHQFNSPYPYALAGLTAAGAKIIVSILWVDTVAGPSALYHDPEKDRPYSRVWW